MAGLHATVVTTWIAAATVPVLAFGGSAGSLNRTTGGRRRRRPSETGGGCRFSRRPARSLSSRGAGIGHGVQCATTGLDRTVLARRGVIFDRRGADADGLATSLLSGGVPEARRFSSGFARAELEFAEGRAGDAILAVLPFTRDEQPAIRGEAWLRLARNYRKAGDTARALDAFQQLVALGDATVQDGPAGLVGRTGRALVFSADGRVPELTAEARALREDPSSALETGARSITAWPGWTNGPGTQCRMTSCATAPRRRS
jgi:hypothetical protein